MASPYNKSLLINYQRVDLEKVFHKDDIFTLSWYNISGSIEDSGSGTPAIRLSLSNDAGNLGTKDYSNAELDALTPFT